MYIAELVHQITELFINTDKGFQNFSHGFKKMNLEA